MRTVSRGREAQQARSSPQVWGGGGIGGFTLGAMWRVWSVARPNPVHPHPLTPSSTPPSGFFQWRQGHIGCCDRIPLRAQQARWGLAMKPKPFLILGGGLSVSGRARSQGRHHRSAEGGPSPRGPRGPFTGPHSGPSPISTPALGPGTTHRWKPFHNGVGVKNSHPQGSVRARVQRGR